MKLLINHKMQLQINYNFNPLTEKEEHIKIKKSLLNENWINNKYHIVSFNKNRKVNLISVSYIREIY